MCVQNNDSQKPAMHPKIKPAKERTIHSENNPFFLLFFKCWRKKLFQTVIGKSTLSYNSSYGDNIHTVFPYKIDIVTVTLRENK